jgi:hypothetical protein
MFYLLKPINVCLQEVLSGMKWKYLRSPNNKLFEIKRLLAMCLRASTIFIQHQRLLRIRCQLCQIDEALFGSLLWARRVSASQNMQKRPLGFCGEGRGRRGEGA